MQAIFLNRQGNICIPSLQLFLPFFFSFFFFLVNPILLLFLLEKVPVESINGLHFCLKCQHFPSVEEGLHYSH